MPALFVQFGISRQRLFGDRDPRRLADAAHQHITGRRQPFLRRPHQQILRGQRAAPIAPHPITPLAARDGLHQIIQECQIDLGHIKPLFRSLTPNAYNAISIVLYITKIDMDIS